MAARAGSQTREVAVGARGHSRQLIRFADDTAYLCSMVRPPGEAALPADGPGEAVADTVVPEQVGLLLAAHDGVGRPVRRVPEFLNAVRMRRLGAALERAPMILCRHAPGKTALPDGVVGLCSLSSASIRPAPTGLPGCVRSPATTAC